MPSAKVMAKRERFFLVSVEMSFAPSKEVVYWVGLMRSFLRSVTVLAVLSSVTDSVMGQFRSVKTRREGAEGILARRECENRSRLSGVKSKLRNSLSSG